MARLHALSAQLLLLASCLAAQQQVVAPKPATALRAGTWKYHMSLLVGDQTVSMTRSTTIAESKDGWTVVDTIDTPGDTRQTQPRWTRPRWFRAGAL